MSDRKHFLTVPSSYIFFRKGDEVLLSRRKNTGYHEGEYAIAAAIREAKEETGVDITPQASRFVHTMYRMRADHVRADYFFEATTWSGEISNPEPEKCEDLTWFPIDQLPDNIIPYIKQALEQYLAGNYYSEFEEIR